MAAGEYSLTRTVTANSQGVWSRVMTADADYRYYATAAGATSGSVLCQPAPTLDGPASRVVPAGRRYTLTGTALPGSAVVLHLHKPGMASNDFSLLRTVTADAAGNWQRPYLASTDYRLYISRTSSDSTTAARYLIQAR